MQVGANVDAFEVGGRVYGMDMRLRTASLAEHAVIDQRRIARMSATVSVFAVAAVALAGRTVLQGLCKGRAAAGRAVLITGVSGGFGTYAVQIAKQSGCHVTGVCSTRNIELVQSLGAAAMTDYTAGYYRQVGDAHAGVYDLAFDVTAFETPASCVSLLAPDGHFVSTMGYARGMAGTLARRRNVSLIRVASRTANLETIGDRMASGALRSVIDSTFPLARAQQAFARSWTGRARGKIVIEVADD